MTSKDDDHPPSFGVFYAVAGVALFAASGSFFTNADEGATAVWHAFICAGAGLYLLIVGGSARGHQIAHRRTAPWTSSSNETESTVPRAGS